MNFLTDGVVIVILLAASLLVLVNDWRIGFSLLAFQYAGVAFLLMQTAIWQVAASKLIVGGVVLVIFILTGRQVNFGRQPSATPAVGVSPLRLSLSTSWPFRLLAAVMIAAAAWVTATQPDFALPVLPPAHNLTTYLLVSLGLLNLGLTEDPMNTGLGALTVLLGFQIFYTSVEQSLAVIALLAAVDFSVALAVSHLAVLRYLAEKPEAT